MTADADAYRVALATGSTTRARRWEVTRRDGMKLGFTDHDRPLAFGGLSYEPGAALAPSEAAASLGLAADDQEVAGALSSGAITAADLRRGLYDGAEVRVHDVDWTAPSARILAGVYVLGEVERGEATFRAELRGRTAGLDRKTGRAFLPVCDAEVGDSRCGVDVTGPPFMESGTVAAALAADPLAFTRAAAASAAVRHFQRGVLTWTSGANAGARSMIRRDSRVAVGRRFDLWRRPANPIAAGDGFDVRAGCGKTWDECVARFANGANFRGFSHVPSSSFPATFGRPGEASQDGATPNPPPSVPAPVFAETVPDPDPGG